RAGSVSQEISCFSDGKRDTGGGKAPVLRDRHCSGPLTRPCHTSDAFSLTAIMEDHKLHGRALPTSDSNCSVGVLTGADFGAGDIALQPLRFVSVLWLSKRRRDLPVLR